MMDFVTSGAPCLVVTIYTTLIADGGARPFVNLGRRNTVGATSLPFGFQQKEPWRRKWWNS